MVQWAACLNTNQEMIFESHRRFLWELSSLVENVPGVPQLWWDITKKFNRYLQERDLWGSLGVDGRTILEWTLKRWVSMRGIGLIRLRIGVIGEPL